MKSSLPYAVLVSLCLPLLSAAAESRKPPSAPAAKTAVKKPAVKSGAAPLVSRKPAPAVTAAKTAAPKAKPAAPVAKASPASKTKPVAGTTAPKAKPAAAPAPAPAAKRPPLTLKALLTKKKATPASVPAPAPKAVADAAKKTPEKKPSATTARTNCKPAKNAPVIVRNTSEFVDISFPAPRTSSSSTGSVASTGR